MIGHFYFISFIVVFLVLFKTINSFSYMVPQDSCYSLNPTHNSTQQLTPSPFKILVSSNFYQHDDEIKGKQIFLIFEFGNKTKFSLTISVYR